MTVWRYTALQRGPDRSVRRSGELSASCAADVRAELRRIGLQVIDLRPLKQRSGNTRRSGGILDAFVARLANRYPERYERRCAFLYPMGALEFELEVVKDGSVRSQTTGPLLASH